MKTFLGDAVLVILIAIAGVLMWIGWHEFALAGHLFFGN
jgi:hypothetical protein